MFLEFLGSSGFPKFIIKSPSFSQLLKTWEKVGKIEIQRGGIVIKKKNYKGRCEKRIVVKCDGICKTYDKIQDRMVDLLSEDNSVKKIRCNVLMDGTDYTSDIVCTMEDDSLVVYECCFRHLLKRPTVANLLQQSREYWIKHGIKEEDWRLAVDAEKQINEKE